MFFLDFEIKFKRGVSCKNNEIENLTGGVYSTHNMGNPNVFIIE